MAILKIARMGHPVLFQRAEPVTDPTAPEIRRLASDMLATMLDAGGAGLAAPQVHVPLRLFLYHVPPGRDPANEASIPPTMLINPAIEELTEEWELGWEGCLSIPGLRAAVPRCSRIRITATDLEGKPVVEIAEGFHARVLQHEFDHLNGVLYPSRVNDFRLFGFEEELIRAQAPVRSPAVEPHEKDPS